MNQIRLKCARPGDLNVARHRVCRTTKTHQRSSTAEGKMPGWWRAIEARADTDWLSRVPRARSVIEPGTTHTLKYIIRTQLFVITFLVLHYSQRRLLCVHFPSWRGRRENTRALSAVLSAHKSYCHALRESELRNAYLWFKCVDWGFIFSPAPGSHVFFCNSRLIAHFCPHARDLIHNISKI